MTAKTQPKQKKNSLLYALTTLAFLIVGTGHYQCQKALLAQNNAAHTELLITNLAQNLAFPAYNYAEPTVTILCTSAMKSPLLAGLSLSMGDEKLRNYHKNAEGVLIKEGLENKNLKTMQKPVLFCDQKIATLTIYLAADGDSKKNASLLKSTSLTFALLWFFMMLLMFKRGKIADNTSTV